MSYRARNIWHKTDAIPTCHTRANSHQTNMRNTMGIGLIRRAISLMSTNYNNKVIKLPREENDSLTIFSPPFPYTCPLLHTQLPRTGRAGELRVTGNDIFHRAGWLIVPPQYFMSVPLVRRHTVKSIIKYKHGVCPPHFWRQWSYGNGGDGRGWLLCMVGKF